ncbi:Xanthine dehydrogenase, molybdenum binding subunit [uncultured Spirochaetota bacterium]|jgi:xanthine dehydrogenase large subunit|nr:Xanthine dehydrogenase, molybdenum binding subunit [uncultured Spirochaetota bacterium]
MRTIDESIGHLRGETRYIDDLPEPKGCLHAAVRLSESARGRILSIDADAALALDPSVMVLRAEDLPGENQIGFTKPDEPVLPEEEWEYWGQPIALVLAETRQLARKAAAALVVHWEELPARIDPRAAAAGGDFILPSRSIVWGDAQKAFEDCAFVVSGRVDSGGQEHVYLETQGAYAEVRDNGTLFLISSTQGPTGVQRAVARSQGLPMNKVEVEARRLGGAFGGKEDQAALWASLAALGARASGKPVKLYLDRKTDFRATGKRHPYTSDFKIGADKEGHILAFEAEYFQNSGCSCDLSPAILARTLLHATASYRVPNGRVVGHMCRTNLPSFTAFRGFGAPQAFFVFEAALDALAQAMALPREELQGKNLYREGDRSYFGMPMKSVRAEEAFGRLKELTAWDRLKAEIKDFNASHRFEKKGAALLPVCFGISFTKLPMNQAGALVHVYQDGSVLVSTGAIEMGQQVSRKIRVIAARTLGIPQEWIRVERTSTLTVANTVPTAASTGSDLNGMAAKAACETILSRLKTKAAELLSSPVQEMDIHEGRLRRRGGDAAIGWKELVEAAHASRIDLSAHGFYATPGLFYDMETERGSPFAYHVYGAACVVVRLDVLRARCKVESAHIVHDSGNSLDEKVDRGQIEGALAQGLGWTLLEDLRFGPDGRLLSDSLSTYKLPDISFMPQKLVVDILPGRENPTTPFNSKAVGEPPLQYGLAAYFALLEALRAAKPQGETRYDIPFIPEKIHAFLSGSAL